MRCVQCGAELTAGSRGRPRRYCGRSCQARAYRARKDGGGRNRRTAARTQRSPGGLDRGTIVATAISLADERGIEAVSMRAVAATAGVAGMTLYRYVTSKSELVGAMVETVLGEYRPAHGLTTWRACLVHEARQEWALYQRHPWLVTVVATTRPPLGPTLLAAVDRPTRALIEHGLDARLAAWTYALVSSYVQGAALLVVSEQAAVRDTGVGLEQWSARRLGHLAGPAGSGRYLWLSALLDTDVDITGAADLEAWFEFGLDRVLDGVQTLVDGPGRSHPP